VIDAMTRTMTFNVRRDVEDDGADAWPERRDHVAEPGGRPTTESCRC